MKDIGVIVQTTTNNKQVAINISARLLDAKKAACIQIGDVESHYWWNGKIASDKEFRISIKTVKSLTHDVFNIIKSLHNYSLPEIILINIDETTTDYLGWIIKETKQPTPN